MQNRNRSMLCDYYELTMVRYFEKEWSTKSSILMFYRSVPDDGGYAIFAGLEQIVDYIENLHFTEDDIDFLRKRRV